MESLDSSHGVHKTHLSGKEGMAFTTNVDHDFFFRGSNRECVATRTGDDSIRIPFRMNIALHKMDSIAFIFVSVDDLLDILKSLPRRLK